MNRRRMIRNPVRHKVIGRLRFRFKKNNKKSLEKKLIRFKVYRINNFRRRFLKFYRRK